MRVWTVAMIASAAVLVTLAVGGAIAGADGDVAPAFGNPAPGAIAAGETSDGRKLKAKKRRARTGKNRGRVGYGRLYPRLQPLPKKVEEQMSKSFSKVNPTYELEPHKGKAVPPGTGNLPTLDADVDDPLLPGRWSTPLDGAPLPTLPVEPSHTIDMGSVTASSLSLGGSGVLTPAPVEAQAPNDFTFFRNQPVIQGVEATNNNVASRVGEPTVANDRDTLLFTGNWYAAVSQDNGITWQYPDPFTQFAGTNAPVRGNGVCCDQKAYAVDVGSYSLVFWLLQYFRDQNQQNTQRLVTYQGRSELQDQAEYCMNDFNAQDDFDLPANRWMDFPQIASTNDYLYMSSNVFSTNASTGRSTWRTSIVWRAALDDLNDGDCDADFWYWNTVDEGSPGLVQGAGDTMFWAAQTDNTRLRLDYVEDNSTDNYFYDRNVADFTSSGSGSMVCTVPDGTDPCNFGDARITAGFKRGDQVGWMWNVAQGSGYSFPHVQGAVFDSSSLTNMTLDDEFEVYNNGYAWTYPSVAVNGRGDLGVTVYRMGGSDNPRARAALVDGVTPSFQPLTLNGIVTGTNGTSNNRWGDYGGVAKYGDCPNTFGSAVYTMQNGSANGNAEGRFVWFGRESDGCPDLVVDEVNFLQTTATAGDALWIGESTRNIGSGASDASETTFYLSRDPEKSSGDLPLGGSVATPYLARGDSHSWIATGVVPSGAYGSYYLLVCADGPDAIDEITNVNNCKPGSETLYVTPTLTAREPYSYGPVAMTTPDRPIDIGSRARFQTRIRYVELIDTRVDPPPLDLQIWALPRFPTENFQSAQLIDELRVTKLGGPHEEGINPGDGGQHGGQIAAVKEAPFTLNARIPKGLAAGRYGVAICSDARSRPDAKRCFIAPSPLGVVSRVRRR